MAGNYRETGTIYSDASDDNDPQPSYTTKKYINVPFQIDAVGGIEAYRGRQLEAGVDYVLECQYLPGVLPDMRIGITGGLYNGKTLNIVRVLPKLFRGRALKMELLCSEKVV